ncbi:hypothetical protein LIER_40612 [Lithospermum erythrorhizon]|uniref:Uncharacterized protein n=1 Tax=Lithospermum erythrorhizon TaxID=34254 RepID=A0AAV3QYL7_LITER
MQWPLATERANSHLLGMRSIFVVALENGLSLPFHPFEGGVLRGCPAQLTPNVWVSINDFYFAYLLACVTSTAKLFFTAFSHRTQKDGFLYLVAKHNMKGFWDPFPSKLGPNFSMPYFFFVSGEGIPSDIPFSFTSHPKSKRSPTGSTQHKAYSMAFTTS